MSHRTPIFIAMLALAALLSACTAFQPRVLPTTLKDAYAGHYLIGTAGDIPGNFTPAELELIKQNFNVITPENCMKPQNIHPAEGRWNWGPADALVDFCTENQIQIVGHCLVWHVQTANWFFQPPAGQTMTKELLLARLKTHIQTLVGRYKGRIKGWDVVNEAIEEGGGTGENLRASNWERIIGDDYLLYAFQYAHEADPAAELYYNDYNIEIGGKHASSLALLKRLLAAHAPITGVGIQGHWGLESIPAEALDKAISDYQALGLKVNITELDVTATGSGGGQFDYADAGPNALNADVPTRQADAYYKIFRVLEKHKDVITRVTFWGLNDRRSWRRGQDPLIFNAQNQPKAAYQSIMDAVLLPPRKAPPPRNVAVGDPNVKSIIRIKAGQDRPFTDAAGNVWAADSGYQNGNTISRAANLAVANTDDPAMYRNERYGMSGYSFLVPNGAYTVKLHFAETYTGIRAAGGRVFSFKVKDHEFPDFDVFVKAGGFGRAYIETVPVEVHDGKIDITFTAKIENPEVNAIEIIPN